MELGAYQVILINTSAGKILPAMLERWRSRRSNRFTFRVGRIAPKTDIGAIIRLWEASLFDGSTIP
jgi:hypothetical protein